MQSKRKAMFSSIKGFMMQSVWQASRTSNDFVRRYFRLSNTTA